MQPQYEGAGVLKEHLHTRAPNSASLFDVSHMGQIRWHGKDAVKFIEEMVVGDIASLGVGEAKLSLIMNEDGGIVDDTVISNAGDYVYMVVNGGCKVLEDSSAISTCCSLGAKGLHLIPAISPLNVVISGRIWIISTSTSRGRSLT